MRPARGIEEEITEPVCKVETNEQTVVGEEEDGGGKGEDD